MYVNFKIINIQGLTKTKGIEVEELIGDRSIVCLTETQKKIRDVMFSKDCKIIENMREKEDRKGGGLMVIYKENRY